MNLRRSLYWALIIVAVTYLAISFTQDWDVLSKEIANFYIPALAVILGLTLVNYILRFLRWELYLRTLGFRMETPVSMRVFGAGLVMVISPGKIGELIKSYLLKLEKKIPVVETLPVVFMERLFDLISLLFLTGVGAVTFNIADFLSGSADKLYPVIWAVGGVTLAVLVVLLIPPLAKPFLHLAARLPVLGRFAGSFETVYTQAAALTRPPIMVAGFILSAAAWWAECLGLYMTMRLGLFLGAGVPFSVGETGFVYAFSTLAGVVSPGGLGITDGLLFGFLSLKLAGSKAFLAALVIRIATLWFGVLIGAVFLTLNYKNEQLAEIKEDLKSDDEVLDEH